MYNKELEREIKINYSEEIYKGSNTDLLYFFYKYSKRLIENLNIGKNVLKSIIDLNDYSDEIETEDFSEKRAKEIVKDIMKGNKENE